MSSRSGTRVIFLPGALVCALALLATAEVADSAATGFTVKIQTRIHASPADVYTRLVHNIGDWWDPAHSYSGDAHNFSLEERPQGCFCEKWAGGSVRHFEVILAVPGKMLRMSGGLGPLQAFAMVGTLTFAFTPAEGGTNLETTYAVMGYTLNGINTWVSPVNSVLTEQVTRLKNFIETGNPAVNAAEPRKK